MTGTDHRAVIAIALVFATVLYGGVTGLEAMLLDDSPQERVELSDDAAVRGTTFHLDRVGRPTVVGEVANGHDGPITNVSVTVTFFRDGEPVATVTGVTLRGTVPSGGTAPFDVHLQNETSVDDYEVEVSYDEGGSVPRSLTVEGVEAVHEGSDRVTVRGTIRNAGDAPIHSPRVIATFYDANGSVIGARTVRPSGTLRPGESTTVRVTLRTLGDVPSLAREFARVELTAVADSDG